MALGTGKLRAATNRVRTSLANNTNEIWTDLIGIKQSKDAGSNSAIEASIKAPGKIGGFGVNNGKRKQGGVAGDEAIIHPTEALVALARLQGTADGGFIVEGSRGVCRVCGGMGHLSSQCKNKYSLLTDDGGDGIIGGAESDLSSDSDSGSSEEKKKKKKKGSKKKKEKSSKKSKKSSKKRKHDSSDSDEPKKKKKSKEKSKSKKSKKSSSSDDSSDSDS
mmetsp:Transcript_33023/g.81252  ORF Transcript_33023/g.81252 Transcript_33023/m.81252 type:complete len:220 (+) Transcript_33023:140-799(+)|eukprot:CAMPEP_0197603542 /NCGR_PEP_ID=MMETSP1326-20131121/39429_1 /TAXON_ID=1155430 /ORGANISM="Genus nov. species nov., Strain RCC2288" /LENGTH=219 /DNA_ID=CAMNT_0043171067 /DNA_START=115 /DNA_END=774 /DNA_ORIENTATION=-